MLSGPFFTFESRLSHFLARLAAERSMGRNIVTLFFLHRFLAQSAAPSRADCLKPVFQIRDDIIDMFGSDRQPDGIGSDPLIQKFLFGKL